MRPMAYIPAKWGIDLPARQIDYVVLHDMEAPELLSTAEAVGRYFQNVERKASTHVGVDGDSAVRYLEDNWIAYGAGGVNANGLHIEHAGYANQSFAEWLDEYGVAMLRISAEVVREWCRIYAIPVVYVDAAGLLRGDRGITTHLQASLAFGGDHWDPGYEFPIDVYIDLVKGEDMPSAEEIAKALLDEPVPSHDYTTGKNADIPLRVALANMGAELSLIRHHLTGEPAK